MTKRALIFDCDGVLADTERDGQELNLSVCNQLSYEACKPEYGIAS